MTQEELEAAHSQAKARKAELDAMEAKGGNAWTQALQEERENLVMYLVDIEDVIEEKKSSAKSENSKSATAATVESVAPAYKPAAGTENSVHLQLIKGHRYSPKTGKEISAPFVQIFSYSEWQLFKKHFASLGYTIKAVLHDPYGEAKKFVAEE